MASSEVSMRGNRGGDNFNGDSTTETRNVSVTGEGQKGHSNRVGENSVSDFFFFFFLRFVDAD